MFKERLRLIGISPERALSRLSKLGITVYDAKKTDKTTVAFWVGKKDFPKVKALYPKGSAYEVQRLPTRGATKALEWLRLRTGVIFGGLLFIAITCAADGLIMRIEIDAPAVYEAKVQATLKEKGVKRYTAYRKDKETEIKESLLAIDGVSYCSMQKRGSVLVVSLKTNAFFYEQEEAQFIAERSGKLEKLVLLRGTALVEEGAQVSVGDTLVEGAIYSPEGERLAVNVVAYATLSCTYENAYECDDAQQAFARAYLEAGLENSKGKLVQSKVEKKEGKYAVTLSYTWTQRLKI